MRYVFMYVVIVRNLYTSSKNCMMRGFIDILWYIFIRIIKHIMCTWEIYVQLHKYKTN